MNIIYKYKLSVLDEQEIKLPINAKILNFAEQNSELFIWCLIKKSYLEFTEVRKFYIFGTGMQVDSDLKYINTCHTKNGFVWHLFENNRNE